MKAQERRNKVLSGFGWLLATMSLAQGFSIPQAWAVKASDRATVEDIQFGGTGCRADGQGVKLETSSSGRRVAFYTPDMITTGEKLQRVFCGIALAVSVPKGQRLVIGRVAVFGQSRLQKGEKASASAELFVPGQDGLKVQDELVGVNRDFYERDQATLTLGCGQDATVRVNSALLASGQAKLRGFAFDLRIETCVSDQ